MKNVLVTGGTGFIGRRLCALLKECGYTVNLLGRSVDPVGGISPTRDGIGIYTYDGSLSSVDHCLNRVRPDCIFHLATLYTRTHQPEEVPDLVQANILFPALLMESMCRHDVNRAVMVGSYWQFENGRNYSPINLYASTKQSSETIAQYYVGKRNLDIRILYVSDTYGPNDPRDKLVANISRSLNREEQVHIKTPLALIDLLHVSDVARALLQCATLQPEQKLRRWRIQSQGAITIADLVSRIVSLLPRRYHNLFKFEPSLEPPPALVAPSFATLLPQWRQEITLESGLASVFLDYGD